MKIVSHQMKEIMERIKTKRESLGLSFQQLADLTQMSKSTLQRYETGGIKNIPLDKLEVLAKALQTTPEWILGWNTLKGDLQMGVAKKNVENNTCVIKSLPHRELSCGYTRVRVMPENYSKIIMIAGVTGKTIQDVVDELLKFAIANTKIEVNGAVIDVLSYKEE